MAEQALFQPFNRNQQRENLESTKETGLLISLIPSLQEDFYVDSLTTGASKETLSKLLLRNPGIKNETAVIEMIHFITCIKADQTFKIGEEELKRGVLAWDMGRMVCLTRIAYDAGFIDESLAWNYICSAGQQCIQAFNDWTEVGKSFLLGQAMEATEKRKQELYIRLYRQATENPNSPWKKRTLK